MPAPPPAPAPLSAAAPAFKPSEQREGFHEEGQREFEFLLAFDSAPAPPDPLIEAARASVTTAMELNGRAAKRDGDARSPPTQQALPQQPRAPSKKKGRATAALAAIEAAAAPPAAAKPQATATTYAATAIAAATAPPLRGRRANEYGRQINSCRGGIDGV